MAIHEIDSKQRNTYISKAVLMRVLRESHEKDELTEEAIEIFMGMIKGLLNTLSFRDDT